MRNRRATWLFSLVLAISACALPSYSVDDALGGGAGGGSGGSLPEIGGMLNGCGGAFLGGPEMVPVPGGYCIDSTEVTWDQYEAWVSADPAPTTADLPPECSWKTDFAPEPSCAIPYATEPQLFPVVCVDWCDAVAYCKAMGKRLCGRIGGEANSLADYADPTKSQWQNACSSGGRFAFQYGSAYDGSACHTLGAGQIQPVQSLASCQSSVGDYAGVYDLNGNVGEWEDSCSGNQGDSDLCRVRGGSFSSASAETSCDADLTSQRSIRLDRRGFRCCWEPAE